jgi:hypothetical protein
VAGRVLWHVVVVLDLGEDVVHVLGSGKLRG